MPNVCFDFLYHDFDGLQTKYQNFYAPNFQVIIDGTDLLSVGIAITGLSVSTDVESGDSAEFTVANAYDWARREFKWTDDYLAMGKRVEVKMGYANQLETVFYGIITTIRYDYSDSDTPSLKLSALDLSYLMKYGTSTFTWFETNHSLIAAELAVLYGLFPMVQPTLSIYEEVGKQSSDYEFLKDLAQQNNYEFFVAGETMYFRSPYLNPIPVTTLTMGKNLRSFHTSLDVSQQVTTVMVHGRDNELAMPFAVPSVPISVDGAYAELVQAHMLAMGGPLKIENVYSTMTDPMEAFYLACSMYNKMTANFLSGNGDCLGIPEIRAGRFIKLDGLGSQFLFPMYIKQATHSIDEGGYTTDFTVGSKSDFISNLINLSDKGSEGASKVTGKTSRMPGNNGPTIPGLMPARVVDNFDPEGLGRIQVLLDLHDGVPITGWARVATLMAGELSGSLFIPDIGTEVLVGFQRGDMTKPYVLGALWNDEFRPPPGDIEEMNAVRKFTSRMGHELIFDDSLEHPNVTIHTMQGQIITMLGEEDIIRITDSDELNSITINGEVGVIIESNESVITLNEAGVTIEGLAEVTVTAPSITIEAEAMVEINGGAGVSISSEGIVEIAGSLVNIG